ncbi:MAG: LamG domain-containing protein [Phycisphaerae bacterium]|nr:LamG domain-containing protein [Phycisphaerae bacterium]
MNIKLPFLIYFLLICLNAKAELLSLDGPWYTGSKYGTPQFSILNNNTFTWGLSEIPAETTAQTGALWTYFPDKTLLYNGDKIILKFSIVLEDNVSSSNTLRFGLFNNGGSSLENNLNGANSDVAFNDMFGYWAEWPTINGIGALRTRIVGYENPVSGTDSTLLASQSDCPALVQAVVYAFSFSIMRINEEEYEIISTLDDKVIEVTTTTKSASNYNTFFLLNTTTGIGSMTFSDIQIEKEQDINFNDYPIISYGGSQDSGGVAQIEGNGTILHLTGNTWKAIALNHEVTANTVIEFDFQSSVQGEEQCIGFDDDLQIQSNNRFKLYGSQASGTELTDFNDYDSYSPAVKHYIIPVGQYYTGPMQYLFFVNDHDVVPATGESFFGNIHIYETIVSLPKQASVPHPEDGAIDVSLLDKLAWTAGTNAISHDIYIGTSLDDILNADTDSFIYKGNHPDTSYLLDFTVADSTYYWKIDEVNDSGKTKGQIWSFTTGSDYMIEDFDEYYDNDSKILDRCIDGRTNSTSAVICPYAAGYLEVLCNNDIAPFYSEVKYVFDASMDWEASVMTQLSFWFRGDSNIDQIEIVLFDETGKQVTVSVVDPCILGSLVWNEITIELIQFAGVNLSIVKGLIFRIGDTDTISPANQAIVGIDEICLKPFCCKHTEALAADMNGDCLIDTTDLIELASVWLNSEYSVVASAPDSNKLLVSYNFNETNGINIYDLSGNGFDAVLVNAYDPNYAWQSGGKDSSGCLSLDGSVYVHMPADITSSINADFTVALWVYKDFNNNLSKFVPINFFVGLDDTGENVFWDMDINQLIQPGWNHLACSVNFTEGMIRIYINGIIAANNTSQTIDLLETEPAPFYIGVSSDTQSNYWHGKIDDFMIYSYALSHNEIVYLAKGQNDQITQWLIPALSPVDPCNDGKIDIFDFAILAQYWLIN